MDIPNDIPKEFRAVYENGYTTESTIDAMNAERLRPDLGGGGFLSRLKKCCFCFGYEIRKDS
ncbi:MAG: hypothetical protein ABH849_01425 [Nanoarchaeota archaeon]